MLTGTSHFQQQLDSRSTEDNGNDVRAAVNCVTCCFDLHNHNKLAVLRAHDRNEKQVDLCMVAKGNKSKNSQTCP